MEALVDRHLPDAYLAHLNDHKISTLIPELQFSPYLAKLFLQKNNSLTMLPPSLFQHMPVLSVLDLSHTSIQSLPPSISKLRSLEEFILRECSLLTELPPEIGALTSLKLFDLEGTEIMYLPKEIGELKTLERLRFSLSTYADDHKERNGIRHIIPRMTILKLTKLKELSISVSPEAEWWEVELLEAIMGDLLFLSDLRTLKLYLPTAKALQRFLRLERYTVPIYSSLWNYRLMTGHCEELPFSVQLDSEANFLKLEKCVKYMNGEGYTDIETADLVRDARALYLRRHWTIEKLSMFDIRRLKYCLLMECNEMQTLVDQDDFCKHKTKPTSHGEGEILGSLQYLSIHFLKKLQRISKGPIGRNSLSCLRILALHTCPELTSIFTECLLDNLQSLNEIIVEDCPKVKCLVNLEEGALRGNGPFLPNVRRISLVDLPELVSVSGGVCIAPQLETLLVFNCMKLDYLSDVEIPRDTMAVKGEIEWWDALKSGKSTWERVFIQLKRDGSLMDQLAEDTNSLQHFLELKIDPSLPGLVNQNSSPDTNEDREHVDQLQIVHNVDLSNKTPNDTRKYVQNGSLNSKFKRNYRSITSRQVKVTVNKGIEIRKALEDGYDWRKYGEKPILGSKYSRSYYRCSSKLTHGCRALKQVQRSNEDPPVFEICYCGKHSCLTVLSNDFSSTATKSACTTVRPRGSSAATESASTITESLFDLANSPEVLDSNEIKSISTRDDKWDKLQIVIPNIDSEVPPDDGYIWSKHGQYDILGATYPSLSETNSCETESALSILTSSGSSTTVESELRVLKNSVSSTTAEANQVIRSEVAVNCSRNLSSSTKTPQNAKQCPSPVLKGSLGSISSLKSQQQAAGNNQIYGTSHLNESANEPLSGTYSSYYALPTESIFPERPGQPDCQFYMKTGDCKFGATCKFNHPKERVIPPPDCALSPIGLPLRPARKEKLADRITELHQLVSPFGKTDATSVLSETCGYIKFLHEQVKVLFEARQQSPKQDLRSQGLCLVPVSSTFPVTNQTNTAWKPPDEPNAYKA